MSKIEVILTTLTFHVFVIGDTVIYTSTASCETGWIEGFKTCYKFVSTPATWGAAQGLCRDMGGNLAVIDNVKKSAFITGYMINHGK